MRKNLGGHEAERRGYAEEQRDRKDGEDDGGHGPILPVVAVFEERVEDGASCGFSPSARRADW